MTKNIKSNKLADIISKQENKFAKKYKKELQELHAEVVEVPKFYKRKKFSKLDTFSKVALFFCVLYVVWLLVSLQKLLP